MTQVAVLFAEGFEEVEALTPVDVLRRAGLAVTMIGLNDKVVTGSHGISVQTDSIFDGDLSQYDLVVVPGGMPGATNLRDHKKLIATLSQRKDQYTAAICAGPIVLEEAGLLSERNFTCYPGFDEQITHGHHLQQPVVIDDKLVTARSVAAAMAFSLSLAELLGADRKQLSDSMVYDDQQV